jgi:hypothetical protein
MAEDRGFLHSCGGNNLVTEEAREAASLAPR